MVVVLGQAPDEKGEWKLKELVVDGQKQVSVGRLSLDGKTWKERWEREDVTYTYNLKTSGVVHLRGKGGYMLGRYELKGDTLRIIRPIMLDEGFPVSPDDFEPRKGMIVSTWTRN